MPEKNDHLFTHELRQYGSLSGSLERHPAREQALAQTQADTIIKHTASGCGKNGDDSI